MKRSRGGRPFSVASMIFLLCAGAFSLPAAAQTAKAKIAIVTWVGYGPLFIAKEKGFFHNIDVDIVTIEELGARHSALTSGNVNFSISTVDLFANEAAQGLPALAILKIDDSYGADGIVAKKEITSLQDLRGKAVALEKATPSHFFLISLLQKAGMSMADIKPRFMTAGDAGAAFVAGQVDAAVTWEPWLTKAKETAFGHILASSRDEPGLIVDLLLVNRDFARTQPASVTEILRGWFAAVEYAKNHEDEANTIMAKALGLEKDEFMLMSQGDRVSTYEDNRKFFGIDAADARPPFAGLFDRAQEVWIKEGLINTRVKAADAVDTAFLRNLSK